MAAAPGTIVLAVADPALRPARVPVHRFTTQGGNHFESTLCKSTVPFTMNHYFETLVITDLDDIRGMAYKHKNGRMGPCSTHGYALQLCYSFRVKSKDITLSVGKDVSLALLLRSPCLEASTFLVTRDQMHQMIPSISQPPPPSTQPPPPPSTQPLPPSTQPPVRGKNHVFGSASWTPCSSHSFNDKDNENDNIDIDIDDDDDDCLIVTF